jgi:hypothetical protein
MAAENSVKMTCDGCGQSRTFVLGKDKREDSEPWYRINIEVEFETVGPPKHAVLENFEDSRIDACSVECASKALAKRLPALPKVLEPLKR